MRKFFDFRDLTMKRGSLISLVLAFANAILTVLVVFFDVKFEIVRLFAFFSFAVFLVLLRLKLGNILFFARTLFLGFIGYFSMMIKAVHGPSAFFSSYEYSTQGIDIVSLMYAGTSLALLGNEIGLVAGMPKHFQQILPEQSTSRNSRRWKTAFFFSIPIVLVATFFVLHSNGPLIFIRGYQGAVNPKPMGSIPAIGVFGLLLAYAATYKVRIPYGRVIVWLLSFLYLVWSMLLRGDRNDALSAILGFFVVYGLVRNRSFGLRLKSVFLFLLPFLIIMDLFGSIRSQDFSTVTLRQVVGKIKQDRFSADVVKFGTVSPIATTFANIVWLTNTGELNLAWGRSYLEFIPRTLPQFLYPDRPRDYAWIFREHDLRAGGGFFELAEAYMNLGLAGCFLIPLLISFFISRLFWVAMMRQSLFSYFLIIGSLSVFTRGAWYQTFAFYRGFTLAVTMYVIFWSLYKMVIYLNRACNTFCAGRSG